MQREPEFDQAASTFFSATWADTGMPALMKLNVSPGSCTGCGCSGRTLRTWCRASWPVGRRSGATTCAGWLERLPYRLSGAWGDRLYDLLAEAAVRFQAAARALDHRFVWVVCLHFTAESLRHGQREGCPGPVDRVLARLEADWAWLASVCGLAVCFGDLTTGNALCRDAAPGGEHAFLIDPVPRIAPWAWDGAYCQAIAAESDVRMIARMARFRRERGLHTPGDADLQRASTLLLAWLGAMWWGIAPWRREYPDWVAQTRRDIEAAAAL